MAGPRIWVIVADDHDMVRSGLAVLLEAFEDFGLAGMAANGQEAVELCDKVEADVVLMDLTMPKMNGIAATRALRQRHPQVQVIAMISFEDEKLLEAAMAAGAAGYVLKNAPIDQVAGTIRAAARIPGARASRPGAHPRDAGGIQPQGPCLP